MCVCVCVCVCAYKNSVLSASLLFRNAMPQKHGKLFTNALSFRQVLLSASRGGGEGDEV